MGNSASTTNIRRKNYNSCLYKMGRTSLWEEEGDTEGETNQNDDGVVEVRDDKEVAHFSLNLMAELSSPQTVKVKGLVKGLEVVALVDGGATHNFIDKELVASRKLPTSNTEDPFRALEFEKEWSSLLLI